jgi:hypothetical protein
LRWPNELLELEQPARIVLEVLDREGRAERVNMCLDAGTLGDFVDQVVDGSIVPIAFPTLLAGHRDDVVLLQLANHACCQRLADEHGELVRHGLTDHLPALLEEAHVSRLEADVPDAEA